MSDNERQPETSEDTAQEPEEDKLLEDLDPEEEEAGGVQGGARRAGGRYGTL